MYVKLVLNGTIAESLVTATDKSDSAIAKTDDVINQTTIKKLTVATKRTPTDTPLRNQITSVISTKNLIARKLMLFYIFTYYHLQVLKRQHMYVGDLHIVAGDRQNKSQYLDRYWLSYF